jgi:DNA mismatch repair ATPase MutS
VRRSRSLLIYSLMALARAAVAHNLVRPTMVQEPLLEIRHGRHILQEQFVERYIANDTVLCGGPDGSHHNMVCHSATPRTEKLSSEDT